MHYWTNEEDTALREHYHGDNRCQATLDALAILFDRTPCSVKDRTRVLRLTRETPNWSRDDLDDLKENYGRQPAAVIAKRLGRSTNALKIICHRRLNGHNQRSNIYTSRETAVLLGRP